MTTIITLKYIINDQYIFINDDIGVGNFFKIAINEKIVDPISGGSTKSIREGGGE